jgi:hypothetical protein
MKVKKPTNRQQPRFEQETVIIWNELEDEATYYTAIPKEWRRMEEQSIQPFRQTEYDRRYRVPKAYIKIKKPGKSRGRSINEIVEARIPKFHTL